MANRRGRSKKKDESEVPPEGSKEIVDGGKADVVENPKESAISQEAQQANQIANTEVLGTQANGVEKKSGGSEERANPRKWEDVVAGNRDTSNGWTLHYSPLLKGTTVEEMMQKCRKRGRRSKSLGCGEGTSVDKIAKPSIEMLDTKDPGEDCKRHWSSSGN